MRNARKQMSETGATPVATAGVVARVPPRFWWLKRCMLVGLLYVAAIVGVRVWAGSRAEGRLGRELDALRALVAGASQESLSADDDPRLDGLLELAAGIHASSEMELEGVDIRPTLRGKTANIFTLTEFQETAAENLTAARLLVAANFGVLVRLDAMLQLGLQRAAAPETPLEGRDAETAKAIRGQQLRTLTRLLCLATEVARLEGRHGHALQHARQMLQIGDIAARSPHRVDGLVCAWSSSFNAPNLLERMISALPIGKSVDKVSGAKIDTDDGLRAVITALLDDQSLCDATYRETLRNLPVASVFMGELEELRRNGVVSRPGVSGPTRSSMDRLWAELSRPFWFNAGAKRAAIERLTIEAFRAPVLRDGPWQQETTSGSPRAFADALRELADYRGSSFGSQSSPHSLFAVRARRQLIATMLAVRLYDADHGALPESLADLTPTYLAELPIDVCGNGELLEYTRSGQDVVIWSVGSEIDRWGQRTNENLSVQWARNSAADGESAGGVDDE